VVHHRGQAVTAVAVVVTLTAMTLMAMTRVATTTVTSAKAQLAADSVALAAVQGGVEAAEITAQAYQAVIVALTELNGDVVVDIELDGQRSTARASR
jgi:hypothetical protein